MLCDVRCPVCGRIYEDKIIFNKDEEKVLCDNCGDVVCEIMPAISASFRLKYNNKTDICSWGNEGYATSQYYKEQKKQCKNNIFPMTGKTKKGVKKASEK